ncbi:MAG TPA: succinate dehydrogenase cytochrome b558 subunit [Pirellulales bacterium]|nr:succinate dehydrogenase cytochrome b558 subunit [Pirellulales bacterium]
MENAPKHAPPAPEASLFFGRHEFLMRRLHSLSGLVPVGAYMCIHLMTNATVLGGPRTFQEKVDTIHSLGPVLPFVEWTFIFIPIIFHAALGIVRAVNCEPNSGAYRYGSNVRYTLQRVTAWIALFFIAWHVFHMHGWLHFDWTNNAIHSLGGGKFDPEHATSTAAAALQPLLVKILYAIGVLACVYHLANGLWTSGITWGIWTTPAAQRRADYVCTAFGLLFAFIGLSALFGMSRADVVEAQAIEQAQIEQREAVEKRVKEIEEQERNRPQPTGDETAATQ